MTPADHAERPEAMGLVCALVYLLAIVNFLPFAFKRDIVQVTSGAGNKDRVLEAQQIETGRFLHRFPLEKVCEMTARICGATLLTVRSARLIWFRIRNIGVCHHPWNLG